MLDSQVFEINTQLSLGRLSLARWHPWICLGVAYSQACRGYVLQGAKITSIWAYHVAKPYNTESDTSV